MKEKVLELLTNPATLTQLAERLGMDRGNLHHVLTTMLAEGQLTSHREGRAVWYSKTLIVADDILDKSVVRPVGANPDPYRKLRGASR